MRAVELGATMIHSTSAERTAKILVERYGRSAFDFAARQVAIFDLADAGESVAEWKAVAEAIARLSPPEKSN
jgi:hypothetical protein